MASNVFSSCRDVASVSSSDACILGGSSKRNNFILFFIFTHTVVHSIYIYLERVLACAAINDLRNYDVCVHIIPIYHTVGFLIPGTCTVHG